MKKITTLLLIGASLLLSSCEYDSVGVSYTSYRSPVYVAPAYPAPVYRRYIYNSPPPDWMRYGGNWVPARSPRRHYHY